MAYRCIEKSPFSPRDEKEQRPESRPMLAEAAAYGDSYTQPSADGTVDD
jgi:hypothetical protein